MAITITQALTFILFVGYITFRLGWLPSISESWYRLRKVERNLFTAFCWTIGFCMLYQTDGSTPFFFFSGAGIAFTGAATMFKSKGAYTDKVHTYGAAICVLGALLGLGFERHCWLPIVAFTCYAILIKMLHMNNKTFWIEITAFVNIFAGLLST